MDRTIVYPGELPAAEDFLSIQRETLREVARIAYALTGGTAIVDGIACVPTQPNSLAVVLTPGTCFWPTVMDGSPFGVLAAELVGTMKLGGYAGETLPLVVPSIAGQDIVYLVQASFADLDLELTVLAYYNAANPTQPFSGPGNGGGQQPKKRVGRCPVSAKAGAPASTGTATPPAADPGYVPLWIITVPHGAVTITANMIAPAVNAPRFTTRLCGGIGADDLATEAAARVAGDMANNLALTADVTSLNAAILTDVNALNGSIQAEGAARAAADTAEATARGNAIAAEATARAAIRPGTSVLVSYSASGNFVVPDGVTKLKITATGGGGGGGASGTNAAGGGGGSGGTAIGYFDVTPGTSIPVTAGTSGVGGVSGNPGSSGGSTSFGSLITATGGAGGGGGNSNGSGGAVSAGGGGGTGYGGQLSITGGTGGDGSNTALTRGGDGASSYWGGGGRAATSAGSATVGEALGSGGGSGYFVANVSGGGGQLGVVVIEY